MKQKRLVDKRREARQRWRWPSRGGGSGLRFASLDRGSCACTSGSGPHTRRTQHGVRAHRQEHPGHYLDEITGLRPPKTGNTTRAIRSRRVCRSSATGSGLHKSFRLSMRHGNTYPASSGGRHSTTGSGEALRLPSSSTFFETDPSPLSCRARLGAWLETGSAPWKGLGAPPLRSTSTKVNVGLKHVAWSLRKPRRRRKPDGTARGSPNRSTLGLCFLSWQDKLDAVYFS